jgi:hypothetical protein
MTLIGEYIKEYFFRILPLRHDIRHHHIDTCVYVAVNNVLKKTTDFEEA